MNRSLILALIHYTESEGYYYGSDRVFDVFVTESELVLQTTIQLLYPATSKLRNEMKLIIFFIRNFAVQGKVAQC